MGSRSAYATLQPFELARAQHGIEWRVGSARPEPTQERARACETHTAERTTLGEVREHAQALDAVERAERVEVHRLQPGGVSGVGIFGRAHGSRYGAGAVSDGGR